MARPRSSARVQTPSDAGPPSTNETRPARATRSQTRSVSVDPPSQLPGRITRATRANSNSQDDDVEINQPKKNTRRGAQKEAAISLDPVPEDVEIEPLDSIIESAAEAADEDASIQDVQIEPLNDTYESVSDDDDASPEGQPEDQALVLRNVSHSAAPSAMTAMTTFSQGELQRLDPDLIMASLTDLDRDAYRLIRDLIPEDADYEIIENHVDQLYDSNSRISKMLKKHTRALAATKDDIFGSQSYIDCGLILRCLLDANQVEPFPEAPWRPDAILYEANLASFVENMCHRSPTDFDIVDILISLDSTFPTPFVSGFVEQESRIGATVLLGETYRLALELRTQLTVMSLLTQKPTSLDEANRLICKIFMDSTDDDVPMDLLAFELNAREWDNIPLAQQEIAADVGRRVESLRRPFVDVVPGGKSFVDALREIETEFSWSSFQMNVLEWAQMRILELNEDLNAHGGTEAVVTALAEEIERRKFPDRPQGVNNAQEVEPVQDIDPVQDTALPREPRPAKKSYTKGAMNFLKKGLSTGQKQTSSAPEAPPRKEHSVGSPEDDLDDDFEDVDDVAPIPPESPTKTTLRAVLASNKENTARPRQQQKKSFVDPQDDGQRVEWDEDDATQRPHQSSRPQFRQPRNLLPPDQQTITPGKRRRDHDIEDPSEDEGFEVDERQPATKRPRVGRPPRAERVMPSTSGATYREATQRATPATATGRPSVSTTPRKNPGQLIEPLPLPEVAEGETPPPLTAYERYQQANQTSKSLTRMQPPKPPRVRQPWSVEEIEALIDLIGEHGCSWAMLKKISSLDRDGDIFANREQLDLRDKARNMKVDFLLAGQEMPTNFDQILLDKKARTKLENHGVVYDQVSVRNVPGRVVGGDGE